MRYFVFLILLVVSNITIAQSNKTILTGKIRSENLQPLGNVTVKIKNNPLIVESNSNGIYLIPIVNQPITITYSRVGYKILTLELGLLLNETNVQDIILISDIRSLEEVKVIANKENVSNSAFIDINNLKSFPSGSGNFESVLKSLPGVSTNNELSSQYSVRGGNFDENLVYINDIEIHRPVLIRNGQQEGLSFINPELAGSAKFSAGGFEARYGDKLSSVLDVKYNKPDSALFTSSAGFNGSSATLKIPNSKSLFLLGIRYKNNKNLLNTQEIKGSYQPNFSDYQLLYQRDINSRLSVSLFGAYNSSNFNLIPKSRKTKFGTIEKTLSLEVDYLGKEEDKYTTLMSALTFVYKPSTNFNIKFINSVFRITEEEKFDIEGSYIFDEIESSFGDSNVEEVKINRGIGSILNYGRNELRSRIISSEVRTSNQFKRSFHESGIRFQHNQIDDKLQEYTIIDSTGYILTYNYDAINAHNVLGTNIISGFYQSTFEISPKYTFIAGVRGNFNSFTDEFLVSPRFSIAYRPKIEKSLLFRLSAGSYNQPPFYRELRNFDGTLNSKALSQKSLHFLGGADYSFNGFGVKVKFTSEIYYKYLNRLTPYKIENLRIRYFAGEHSKGYATGADFSLSGEFVKGLQSSFRLSLMKTEEDIANDFYLSKDSKGNMVKVEPGYLKRPTDQRLNFSIFFQDRLLKDPSYKVHLTMLYGGSLPTGPPGEPRYFDVFKIPSYKRVDIGFSKDFLETQKVKKPLLLQKYFTSIIAYAEIYNLLDIQNTVSYLWIKDVSNNQFAIPNYLTSRQLNFKIIAKLNYKR